MVSHMYRATRRDLACAGFPYFRRALPYVMLPVWSRNCSTETRLYVPNRYPSPSERPVLLSRPFPRVRLRNWRWFAQIVASTALVRSKSAASAGYAPQDGNSWLGPRERIGDDSCENSHLFARRSPQPQRLQPATRTPNAVFWERQVEPRCLKLRVAIRLPARSSAVRQVYSATTRAFVANQHSAADLRLNSSRQPVRSVRAGFFAHCHQVCNQVVWSQKGIPDV